MKRLITAIIIISILFCQIIIIFAYKSEISKKIEMEIFSKVDVIHVVGNYEYQILKEKFNNNEKLSAGILGYFWRESFCQSDVVAGAYHLGNDYAIELNKNFTEKIDAGLEDGSTREEFIHSLFTKYGGYGLGQWSALIYDGPLFDFAQDWGTSIADAEMQCAFTVKSIKDYSKLWDLIKDEDDVLQIGRYIGIYYDGSPFGAETIASKAQEYYEKYGTQ